MGSYNKNNKYQISSMKTSSHDNSLKNQKINFTSSCTPNQKVLTPKSSFQTKNLNDNEIPHFLAIPSKHKEFSMTDSENIDLFSNERSKNNKRRANDKPVLRADFISLDRRGRNNQLFRSRLQAQNNCFDEELPLDLYIPM